MHVRFIPPQQVLVNWISLVKPEADAASNPVVALNSNNQLELFVRGIGKALGE